MSIDTTQIQHGWDVYGNDGDKIGDVSEVGPNYVLVTKGFLFTKDIYIPTTAVTGIEQGRVYLNIAKDQIDSMGWDAPPSDDAYATSPYGTATGTVVTDQDETVATQSLSTTDTGYVETDRRDTGNVETAAADTSYTVTERATPTTDVTDEDSLRVQRYEEELQAQKVEREAGVVRVTKDVEQEQRTLEVPVTREEVHVEARSVDRPVTDTANAFTSDTIEVPVREEDVQVRKEARVAEEFEIEKRAIQETETVTDTVRKERVNIEEVGDVDVARGSGTDFDTTRS